MTQIGNEGLSALLASPYLDRELQLILDGELFGLPRRTWDDQGKILHIQWFGEPPAEVKARFRAEIETDY